MLADPLVSIIIPTHRFDFCRQAINCALAQTYKNIEILISDNSSDCDIQNYVSQFGKIRYYRNTDKSALTTAPSNISNGLKFSRGDYIKFLFDDDLMFPHTIEAMVRELIKLDYKKIGIVTSHRHVIDNSNKILSSRRILKIQGSGIVSGIKICEIILLNVSNVIGEFSTVMFNRSYLPADDPMRIYDFYNEKYYQGLIDVPIYLNILREADLLVLPYELSAFRIHENSGSNVNVNPQFHFAVTDWLRLINAGYRLGILTKAQLASALKNYNRLQAKFVPVFKDQLEEFASLYEELLKQTSDEG